MSQQSDNANIETWTLDQLAKSAFFHRKLHEWKLLEIAEQLDAVRGENLAWNDLSITEQAWNKVIHSGIKPVVIFAHPDVLRTVSGSVGYYRMLAMVSQKSMKRIGHNLDAYEQGRTLTDNHLATNVAQHLNLIISTLIETDQEINAREFDLWRGMAAGSQAQGSWQNNKGAAAEITIRELVLRRLQENGFLLSEEKRESKINLLDGRTIVFADEPDIAVYQDGIPLVAVEIKGGIDTAGVLERIGAALKSLRRTRQENPNSVTILILHAVSMTERAQQDLSINSETISLIFSLKDILDDIDQREKFFEVLGI